MFKSKFGIQKIFVFTDDGVSLISGFTKILCSPDNPLLENKEDINFVQQKK